VGNTVLADQSLNGSASVFALRSHEIDDHWFWIERLLKRVENPDWTLRQVKTDLKSAQAQVWVLVGHASAPAGIVITRIENFHDTRWGLVWIAAGEGLEHVPRMLGEIEKWFRSMGCSRSEISGRKGWERVLPGYEFKAVTLVKELG
jgi:hypothetical protein